MAFPIDDWQFWVVSIVVLAIVSRSLWKLRPKKQKITKVELTIDKTGSSSPLG